MILDQLWPHWKHITPLTDGFIILHRTWLLSPIHKWKWTFSTVVKVKSPNKCGREEVVLSCSYLETLCISRCQHWYFPPSGTPIRVPGSLLLQFPPCILWYRYLVNTNYFSEKLFLSIRKPLPPSIIPVPSNYFCRKINPITRTYHLENSAHPTYTWFNIDIFPWVGRVQHTWKWNFAPVLSVVFV